MARTLPRTDVAIIGLGWTGAIMAYELTGAGLNVVALERGVWRDTATDFPPSWAPDELRYAIHLDLFQRPEQSTVTLRNKIGQTALPVRKFSSFLPGNGVGGAGVHWNGMTYRFLETDFKLRSHLTKRYGSKILPENMTIQDWPVSYQDLEPHYDRFEKLTGISGTAGNLDGKIQPGGNPFEGPRSSEYPTPANKQPLGSTLYGKAAQSLGYHPFPVPSANLSQTYTNPLGVAMGQCTYCGFCERFGCGNYSKASPQTCVLPALMLRKNFEARTNCNVTKINLDSTGKKATGVTYVDQAGETLMQPADMVLVCAFSFNCVHLLLLSGIGKPYDPKTNTGVVGRNYAYQCTSGVLVKLKDTILNPFISGGAIGVSVDDFNGDNFDHSGLGFVGGGVMSATQTGGRPIGQISYFPDDPKWGSGWKKATKENYQSVYALGIQGSVYSYRDAYLDLDPTYKDPYGSPLLRMTFDWHENELKMSAFVTKKLAGIGKAMGASRLAAYPRTAPYSVVPYQTTHNTGGAVMGDNPSNSVVNRYLQSWDVSNVFVFGASVFPQNAGYNPTGTVGATTYWALDAIKTKYLKNPGPMVPM
ncbi:GMC family oxidoreductase [Acidiphilium sp. AL]|uniref:GMC family oxidoreductase n=1 Tax=Acidiphilium sp. AL TaxID=2871704 RepID=UPI0021CB3CD5|nr:GMC family oxidoreductase [Acidiphilium sp. AL]MCU4160769.1 GMC family oxidoreductase [Acidiphilium sp. AL]